MSEAALSVLRRDRLVVAGALGIITVLAWGYILWLVHAMPVTSVDGVGLMAPTMSAWSPTEFTFAAIMWAVMMVGMMTPSVAPTILLYVTVGRQAALLGSPLAPAGWFAAGYLLCWALFALVAAAAQGALQQAALLTPMLSSASQIFGGAVLVAVGALQWSPLKDACLGQCQTPLHFIQRHGGFRAEPLGSLQLGLLHGAYCVGCCWALMALLFVGGVMNVLWIAGLAILVLLEKTIPGKVIPRIAGLALIGLGAWMLIGQKLPVQ